MGGWGDGTRSEGASRSLTARADAVLVGRLSGPERFVAGADGTSETLFGN